MTIHGSVIANRRASHGGDFDISREFGRRLLAGEPLYAGGVHYPYTPSAALFFSPLALVEPGTGLFLRYATALTCLWSVLFLMARMSRERIPAATHDAFAVGVLTLVLASHYLIRDLDDGGPHIVLLAVLVGGIYFGGLRRDGLAGGCFGLATSIKAPAALFLAYFVWRRQWRLALSTAAATAVCLSLPAVWMGPESWWRHQREWARVSFASVAGEPIPGARESEERIANQALRASLMRYLTPRPDFVPERLSALDHLPLLRLPRAAAGALGSAAALGLLAFCWARAPARRGRGLSAGEGSEVLILSLLLAPVAWTQHLVLMVPALYLVVAEQRAARPRGGGATAALALYALLALLLNREILGKPAYLTLLAYGLHTACMLLILGLLVARDAPAGEPRRPR